MDSVTEEQTDKYHWIVLFHERGLLYPYRYRDFAYMTAVVKKFYDEHGRYPYRMWAMVNGEMRKVNIS